MIAYRYIRGCAIQITQENPDEATVEYFYVDPNERGKHIGTRLMNATCADADREEVTLFLEPVPFAALDSETKEVYLPSLTFEQLCAFYRKFGFRFISGGEIMKRLPKKEE